MTEPFDHRLREAIKIAEEYSPYTSFNANYPPLFAEVWKIVDPECCGEITAAKAEEFAAMMVQRGWPDWSPTERERAIWQALEDTNGCITLEEFAEISENEHFEAPPPRRVSAASRRDQVARQLAEGHSNLMAQFTLPTGPPVNESEVSAHHCTKCENRPMEQQPYVAECTFCDSPTRRREDGTTDGTAAEPTQYTTTVEDEDDDEVGLYCRNLLPYQCMCVGCAAEKKRCTGCGVSLLTNK